MAGRRFSMAQSPVLSGRGDLLDFRPRFGRDPTSGARRPRNIHGCESKPAASGPNGIEVIPIGEGEGAIPSYPAFFRGDGLDLAPGKLDLASPGQMKLHPILADAQVVTSSAADPQAE